MLGFPIAVTPQLDHFRIPDLPPHCLHFKAGSSSLSLVPSSTKHHSPVLSSLAQVYSSFRQGWWLRLLLKLLFCLIATLPPIAD